MPDPIVSRVKPKRTPEQIALEGRSPNRKPRFLTKQAIIGLATQGKTLLEIAQLLKLSPSAMKHARERDKEFNAALREAFECARLAAKGKLSGLLPDSVAGIEATVKGKNENALQYQACRDNVRGLGVWTEKQEQEQSGVIEHIIKIVREPVGELPSGDRG